MACETTWTLEREQDAFDSQLDDLLKEHAGKFVLWHHGKLDDLYDNEEQAYKAGLERYGLDEVFLISEVVRYPLHPASVSWEAGVMFG
jgi:hypothetical protein